MRIGQGQGRQAEGGWRHHDNFGLFHHGIRNCHNDAIPTHTRSHIAGACYMPTEVYKTSIVLSHWGRLDLDHRSNSAYVHDNYSYPLVWPGYQV